MKYKNPESDILKYSKFIIVDKKCRPMAWGGDQLCYCTSSHWQDTHFPLRVYSKKRAMELINKSKNYRKENTDKYYLMPVASK